MYPNALQQKSLFTKILKSHYSLKGEGKSYSRLCKIPLKEHYNPPLIDLNAGKFVMVKRTTAASSSNKYPGQTHGSFCSSVQQIKALGHAHSFSFALQNTLLTPDMVLKSCFEHMSCACVAFFARLALTQAGSCQKQSPMLFVHLF